MNATRTSSLWTRKPFVRLLLILPFVCLGLVAFRQDARLSNQEMSTVSGADNAASWFYWCSMCCTCTSGGLPVTNYYGDPTNYKGDGCVPGESCQYCTVVGIWLGTCTPGPWSCSNFVRNCGEVVLNGHCNSSGMCLPPPSGEDPIIDLTSECWTTYTCM